MGRIVESLKSFYKKQGGTPSAVAGLKSISSVIDKISDLTFGGGGSSDVFVVSYKETSGTWSTEGGVTFADISAALAAGKVVYAKDAEGVVYSLAYADTTELFFVSVLYDNGAGLSEIHHLKNGTITSASVELTVST